MPKQKPKYEMKGQSVPEIFFNRYEKDPDHLVFSTKRNSKWVDKTAGECFDYIFKCIAGLQALGFGSGDSICIFSENREEWTLTDYAAQWLNGSTTAIYTTSSPENVDYILNQSETKVLFVSNDKMLRKLQNFETLKSLQYVVAWDQIDQSRYSFGSVKFLTHKEFLKAPISNEEAKRLAASVDPDQTAILLYTSGTTGEPKGVMLTQSSFVANIRQMHNTMPLHELTVTVSFLPLCHIYERSLQTTLILAGLKICFAESVDSLIDNIQEVRPDMMIGVPRVFEKMYVGIHEKIKTAPFYQQILAKTAFEIGKLSVPWRVKAQKLPLPMKALSRLADEMVFNKIKAITGGRLKFFISGGAPLSKEIAEFFFAAGITIVEGYGLSETLILCFNRPWHIKFGSVGQPFEKTEIKTAEDGEILVRGPQVMKGYFKQPELAAEAFTEDGFFRTGDIGEIDEDGFLFITDRKKEIIITAAGKNVAPQPIENSLKSDPLIEQVVVVGDRRKYLVALIVPNLELCRSWAASQKVRIDSLEEAAKSPEFKLHLDKVVASLNTTLGRYATIKYFAVLSKPFTIEGGELTPTLKIKRRVIEKKYHDLIDSLYPAEDRIAS